MRTALVTGASSGIGLELARVFASEGWSLVLVARSDDKLHEIAAVLRKTSGVDIKVIACDLAVDGAAGDLVERLRREGVSVDALVNNAGVATHGNFVDIPVGSELDEIHLNVLALTHLTKLLLPPMVARKKGYLLNVASTAGFQPGPLMAVYYATKAYVLSLTESLANELRRSGVNVTALCPGPTETGFQARTAMPRTRLFSRPAMNPAVVARAGYDALMRGQTIVIPGFRNVLMAFSIRLVPRAMVAQIVRNLNDEV